VSTAQENACRYVWSFKLRVWINQTENHHRILEQGAIEEGLAAAAAISDDRIMKQTGRAVRREAFTHGSPAERIHWFKQGMKTGQMQSCNTFG
jgi:predicted metalloprotease